MAKAKEIGTLIMKTFPSCKEIRAGIGTPVKGSEYCIDPSEESHGKEFSERTHMKPLWKSKNLLVYPEGISVARLMNF